MDFHRNNMHNSIVRAAAGAEFQVNWIYELPANAISWLWVGFCFATEIYIHYSYISMINQMCSFPFNSPSIPVAASSWLGFLSLFECLEWLWGPVAQEIHSCVVCRVECHNHPNPHSKVFIQLEIRVPLLWFSLGVPRQS